MTCFHAGRALSQSGGAVNAWRRSSGFQPIQNGLAACLLAGAICFSDGPLCAQPGSEVVPASFPGAALAGTQAHAFRLRGHSPNHPHLGGEVSEVGGPVPHLQVRSDYQIVAYSRGAASSGLQIVAYSRGAASSGLAAVGPWGTRILVADAGDRYEPKSAFVSSYGRFVALVVRGQRYEEILLVHLDPESPSVRTVRLPSWMRSCEVRGVKDRSLTLTSEALFFVACSGDERWFLCRAPLEQSEGTVQAQSVAGPFEHIGSYLAHSPTAVAFLAGEDDDELDVYCCRAGTVVNVTRSPDEYLPHSPDRSRVAVSADGSVVAYNLEIDSAPETFYHPVDSPGRRGRQHITADGIFAPYIEMDIFIFFVPDPVASDAAASSGSASSGSASSGSASLRLIISAGHDRRTMDLYSYRSGGNSINLTRTGSAAPTFSPGKLAIQQVVLATPGVLVIDALYSDYPGSAGGVRGIIGVSPFTGATLFQILEFVSVGSFSSVGDDLYFEATTTSGDHGLYRVRNGSLTLLTVEKAFVRGDANLDGRVEIWDSLNILSHVLEGAPLECQDAADADDNGHVEVGDAILIQHYLTGSIVSPPPPFPSQGLDPTPDGLSCSALADGNAGEDEDEDRGEDDR